MANDIAELCLLHEQRFGNGKGYGVSTTSSSLVGSGGGGIGAWPAGHIAFDEQNAINLPAVGTTATIVQFQVPVGYDGIINAISNVYLAGGWNPTTQDVVWRILADDKPIRNFENITSQKGDFNTPRQVEGIRVYANQVIKLVVEHVSNLALNGPTGGSLSGYFYPKVDG